MDMANDRSSEIRFMAPAEHVAVLDGVCSGTNRDRTSVMREILQQWADRRLHEATVLLRVAARNPTYTEDDRKGGE